MDDWSEISVLESTGNTRIREWKFESDSKMVFFWLKLRGDRTDTSKDLYLCFNIDKDNETGSSVGNCAGTDASVKMKVVSDDTPTFFNGVVTDSEIRPAEGATVMNQVVCYGFKSTEDSECYVEIGVPRNLIGLPEAGAEISVECSYDWYVTGPQNITLK